MKLVLEILPHGAPEQVSHRIIEKFPVTVGRGFQNDVILADPHIDPQHLRIDAGGKNWIVRDLGSVNGVFLVNAVRQRGGGLTVQSGDSLRIGRTELRFYAPDHAVAAALPLQEDHPAFAWLARPVNAWLCFLLALALTQAWAFLEIWSDKTGMTLAGAALGTVGTVVVWTTLWAAAGKLILQKPNFRSHAAIISLYLVAGALSWYIETYADFLANENWLANALAYGVNFILLALLLYGSLSLASKMERRRRQLSSVLTSLGIISGIFGMNLVSAKNFNQMPPYPATLKPYLSRLMPADDINAFMAGNEKLFVSGAEFKKSED
jgi:hypothetical protein